MQTYNFTPPASMEHHVCAGSEEGDWIIYSCPKCDYEMRENWQTGEMKVKNVKMQVRHSGSYLPAEYVGYSENVH